MFRDEEIHAIVHHYRQPIPEPSVASLDDVTSFENSVLLSYLLADVRFTHEQLVRLLRNPARLEARLRTVPKQPNLRAKDIVMDAAMNLEYDPVSMAHYLASKTGDFGEGYGNAMVIAKRNHQEHTFPSGHRAAHWRISKEYVANVPIVDGGYGTFQPSNIFVRDHFVTFMSALADAKQDHPNVAPLREHIAALKEELPGIIIAHEIGEMEFRKQYANPTPIDAEVQADVRAIAYLENRGVPRAVPLLYHTLRAGPNHNDRPNVSTEVLKEIASHAH